MPSHRHTEQKGAPVNDPEYWITAEQVAARVALTPATIRKWADDGKITAYKIGKSVRFKASDVDKLATPRDAA